MGLVLKVCLEGSSCSVDSHKMRNRRFSKRNIRNYNHPKEDNIYDGFLFSDLIQVNDAKYYKNIRNTNSRVISFKDLLWRPKLEPLTRRGSEILKKISNSKAIQKLIKENGWQINSLKEITLHNDINNEVKYSNKSKCLGYNGIISLCDSDCIALVIHNRTDEEIFHTLTHELAHMMNDTHNSYFYYLQKEIIKSIFSYNK
eukprot:430713_1